MLQPRVVAILAFCCLYGTIVAQLPDAGPDKVKPTPALNQDVTTVLLVDNSHRPTIGKYLSLKPELGLIKSTARTFIHDGVTTEYATQVLGTTLDNGRLYAQLLTTSSRVIFDRDESNDPTTDITATPIQLKPRTPPITKIVEPLRHNSEQLFNEIDVGRNPSLFIKNTDYIAPNNAVLVYPSRHAGNIENDYKSYARQGKEYITAEHFNHEPLPEQFAQIKVIPLGGEKNRVSFSSSSSSSNNSQGAVIVKPEKVKSDVDLPTFTIRNEFAPSGFSFDDPIDVNTEQNSNVVEQESRDAKLLFRGGKPMDDIKSFSSVTYYGFADFTTIVGDTVIVFSPSTQPPAAGGHVTSITGEATLKEQNVATTVKTFMTQSSEMETQTVKGHPINMATILPTTILDSYSSRNGNENSMLEESKTETTQEISVGTTEATSELPITTEFEPTEKGINIVTTPEIHLTRKIVPESMILSPDAIQPSETSSSTAKPYSIPSSDDIAKIFASLAQVDAAKKASSAKEKEVETSSETQVLGGVTTIFFENDPFLLAATPTVKTSADLQTVAREEQLKETTTKELPTTLEENETTTFKQEAVTLPASTTAETTEEETLTKERNADTTTEVEQKIATTENQEIICASQVVPATVFKTYTYLTTFYIPLDDNEDQTTTSIKSNTLVSSEIIYNKRTDCPVEATSTLEQALLTPTIEKPVVKEIPETTIKVEEPTTQQLITENAIPTEATTEILEPVTLDSTTMEIVTEKKHVTEEEKQDTIPASEDDEEEDEVELLYKTFYTTYTYLTTFFHESMSSISSRKEVVTNIVTSSLSPDMFSSDGAFVNLINGMAESGEILPTKTQKIKEDVSTSGVGIGRPTTSYKISESDLVGINQYLQEEKESSIHVTPSLDEKFLETTDRTLYTTYTYFTTIFVDGETELSSRTEVFTNIIKADIAPTKMVQAADPGSLKTNSVLEQEEDNDVLPASNRSKENTMEKHFENRDEIIDNLILPTPPTGSHKYSTMLRGSDSITAETEQLNSNEHSLTMVTDVRTSSSNGDSKIIEHKDRNDNLLLDDQISSESNTEEIMPSATLLLQTSYTTFTYFTTMYVGSSSSNILSRLETVTNVVTETVLPTMASALLQADETTTSISLPVTYFTTFTYWTTLFKDGITTTTSREETISNVVTPSVLAEASVIYNGMQNNQIIPTAVIPLNKEIKPTEVVATQALPDTSEQQTVILATTAKKLEPTTYYTTYTYFTTSYIGDQTVLNSRLETVTNLVTPTSELVRQTARAFNLDGKDNQLDSGNEKGVKTNLVQPVYVVNGYEVKNEDTQKSKEKSVKPTGIVSINQGKIVDADGISTIFYTTKAVGTYVNDLYAQILESTSSVQVDDIKKALQTSDSSTAGQRTYKTGLVRLIEGTQISNSTTTLYQSKVIGTIIDGRYAQIIESTSSFLIEKTIDPTFVVGRIEPSKVLDVGNAPIDSTSSVISPTPAVVESSISDSLDGQNDDDYDDDSNKKNTFTPKIRPFASNRNRPTFNPKRKTGNLNSATIITRSDFTPTITATPALKLESSKNRFGGRRSSSSIQASGLSSSFGGPVSGSTGFSSRKFSRPKASSNLNISPSSGFGSSRGRSTSSARIQPTSNFSFGSSSSGRRPGFRGSSSSTLPPRSSSSYPLNTRLRGIRPTSAFPQSLNTATSTTPSSDSEEDEDNVTNTTDDNEEEDENEVTTTTESSRRSSNPLLKFRRPQISRTQGGATSARPTVTISTRRSPLARTTRLTTASTTTTTSKPKARSFSRPPAPLKIQPPVQPRSRPANNLFPPRGLFSRTTAVPVAEEEEKDDDENGLDDDSDYEESKAEEVREKGSSIVNKRSQSSRSLAGPQFRSKRQAEYGTRPPSYQPRFRRPTTARSRVIEERIDYSDEITEAPKPPSRQINRFATRSRQPTTSPTNAVPQNTKSRIRPTSASSSQNRAQFTLRDNGISNTTPRNSFRRPTTASSRRNTTPPRTSSSSRFRSYNDQTTYNKNTKQTTSRRGGTRSRNTSRSRSRNENLDYSYVQPSFDGTITVTHHIPTETKIPTVQNGITEYKNILTDRTSKEILGPKQYSTSVGGNGIPIIVLTSEVTNVNNNGFTEVTQFLLNETPTTSVTFTPTTIRGRKTSFSHVIPSTVYQVEQVISTIQPQISANAPLANILLSQLLLGNLGFSPQQNLNPLLGLPQPQPELQTAPATPVTELKTRTTTYVTTVTSAVSTVIPLTFRGKEILTTIVESSTNVVTATEFIVDTVVSTPMATLLPQQQQQNAQQAQLAQLLPLLLQQQQQQQQQQLPTVPQDPVYEDSNVDGKHFDNIQSIRDSEIDQIDEIQEVTTKKSTKKGKKNKKNKSPPPQQETSVITLYVSGRRPGDFSTVLSTVIVGQDDSNVRKREASYIAITPSRLSTFTDKNDKDIYMMEARQSINDIYDTDINLESSQYVMGIEHEGVDFSEYKLFEQTPTLETTEMPFFRLTDLAGVKVQPQTKVVEKIQEGTIAKHQSITTITVVNPNSHLSNRNKRNAIDKDVAERNDEDALNNKKHSDNFSNSTRLNEGSIIKNRRQLRRKKILRSVQPVHRNNAIDEKRSTTIINSTRRRVAITRKNQSKVTPTQTQIMSETKINEIIQNVNKTEPKRRKVAVTRRRQIRVSKATTSINSKSIGATPVLLKDFEPIKSAVLHSVVKSPTIVKGKYRNPKFDARKFAPIHNISTENQIYLPVIAPTPASSLPNSTSINLTVPLPTSYELETSVLETLVYSSTRIQTLTFVVTRVSNDESLITTSTSYRDKIQPVTSVITKIQTLSIIPVDDKNTLTLTIVPTKFNNIVAAPTVTIL